MLNADVLLLDEPSSNLDYQSIALLKGTLAELKSKGYTIIVIEHRLYYLADVCDRLIVFECGKMSRIYEGATLKAASNDELHLQGLRGLHLFQNSISNPSTEKVVTLFWCLITFSLGMKSSPTFLKESVFCVPRRQDRFDWEKWLWKDYAWENPVRFNKRATRVYSLYGTSAFLARQKPICKLCDANVDFQLFGCSVYDDLLLGSERSPNIENRIHSILSLLGLSSLESQHPTTLSMGQKQRLVIAASYLLNKRINVFDEPTSGLDYGNMKNVCDLIESITGNENASIVITHDYEFILSVCNRVILLENGKITRDFPLKIQQCWRIFLKKNYRRFMQ